MESRSRQIEELSIRNIGVIEQASLSLGPGFNVLTGETGAGKTMVLTGLNLISGARADTDLIRRGSDRLAVSVAISLKDPIEGELGDLIDEHSPDMDENSLILQRSVSSDGRSKAIIGSNPATLSLLQRFADELFVIHGQSTNHKLVQASYQLELLDRTKSECQGVLLSYREALDDFESHRDSLVSLQEALKDRDREIENTERLIRDLERVCPQPGEWIEGDSRILRLDSVEEIRSALANTLISLADESQGALTNLHQSIRNLDSISGRDETFEGLKAQLRSAELDIDEVVRAVQKELDELFAEPGELDRLRERRSVLRQLLQRYRHEIASNLPDAEALDALLELLPAKKALLADLNHSDMRLAEISAEVEAKRTIVQEWGERLSAARRGAAEALTKVVNEELRELGLARAAFSVSLETTRTSEFGKSGMDQVEFLFAAHEGERALPLHKGASGGELSRVMLGIELALADQREVGTLIFDEIDAGIGGETGLIIGERISELAKRFQVIVITHLAQVAVWADRHFRIEKDDKEEVVLSSLQEVRGEERVSEIARMLSGQSSSAVALDHARELLKHAQK